MTGVGEDKMTQMVASADAPTPTAPAKRKPFYRDLSFQVLIGMAIGVAFGALWPTWGVAMKPFGDAFIKLIQMAVGPIIFCTVVHGIAGSSDMKSVGRIAIKALIYFEIITSIALVIGMVVGNLWQAGTGMHIDPALLDPKAVAAYTSGHGKKPEGTVEFLLNIIPSSIVDGFAKGDILEILFFSVLFAVGLASAGEAGKPVVRVIESTSKSLFWIIGFAMRFAPLASFGAMAFTVGQFGLKTLGSLGSFIAEFYVTCALFILLVLWPVSRWAGFSLFKLMRYIRAELLLVIGTSSSETVFPQLTQKLTKLGISEEVVGLVLPTAYTFNHDGTCLYFAAATIFLAQATGTPLDWQHQLGLLAVLLITSKGAAGVSGAALVILAITLAASHSVPVAAMSLLIGIHRLLSSAFVFTNIAGNAVATAVVGKWEKAVDEDRFEQELNEPHRLAA
jgi:aerobic C4-dicarboxylate transport protein